MKYLFLLLLITSCSEKYLCFGDKLYREINGAYIESKFHASRSCIPNLPAFNREIGQ